jgi:hypothetical protein
MFDVYLTTEPVPGLDPGINAVYGRIHIESFSEWFAASLMFWNHEQYAIH